MGLGRCEERGMDLVLDYCSYLFTYSHLFSQPSHLHHHPATPVLYNFLAPLTTVSCVTCLCTLSAPVESPSHSHALSHSGTPMHALIMLYHRSSPDSPAVAEAFPHSSLLFLLLYVHDLLLWRVVAARRRGRIAGPIAPSTLIAPARWVTLRRVSSSRISSRRESSRCEMPSSSFGFCESEFMTSWNPMKHVPGCTCTCCG